MIALVKRVALGAGMLAVGLASAHAGDGSSRTSLASLFGPSTGLEVNWRANFQVDSTRGGVVEVVIHVNSSQSTTFFEVRRDGQRIVISENDLDPRGQRMGVEGAEKFAMLRKEALEAGGGEATVERVTVPAIEMYGLTHAGVVHAVDAETGRTRWVTAIGNPRMQTLGLGVNDTHVVTVNGSSAYCLEASTGKLLWSRPCRTAPGSGVALSQNYAYVTELSGIVEAFPLNETGIPSEFFVSVGHAYIKPLVTAHTVSWSTTRGHYNVAANDRVDSIWFRVKTDAPIRATSASSGAMIYVTSKDGKLYGIDESRGTLAWQYAAGQPISQAPIVAGSSVLLITDTNELHNVDGATGQPNPNWPSVISGIRQFVGYSGKNIYVIDTRQQLVALRADTGARGSVVPLNMVPVVISNQLTDRLYLADGDGGVVCLRETGQENPLIHSPEPVAESTDQPVAPAATPTQPPPAETPPVDPADPFGNKPPDDRANPPPANPADPFGNQPAGDPAQPNEPDMPEDPGDNDSPPADDSPEDPFQPSGGDGKGGG